VWQQHDARRPSFSQLLLQAPVKSYLNAIRDIINIERPTMVLHNRGMPRTSRASVGGMWYHVLNRGNRREAVFHKPGDFDAFVEAIIDAPRSAFP
jgi:hypothetical protein